MTWQRPDQRGFMKKACIYITIFLVLLVVVSLVLTAVGRHPTAVLKSRVGLVTIEGVLGVDINTKDVIDDLKEFREDSSVKAVVVRINSPGGSVAPSQEIYESVRKLSTEKSVVVSMDALAASGGYYIAVAADKIFANPGTMTGSIGVIMEVPNVEGLMEKVGLRTEVIKSGQHKDLASMFRTMTDADRAVLQGVLDDVHGQFIDAVAEGRGMPTDQVRELADGRVFTGRQAHEAGLVDVLGTLEDAVAEAGRMAGIEGEPDVVTREKRFSLRDLLRGGLADTASRWLGPGRDLWGYSPKYLMSFW